VLSENSPGTADLMPYDDRIRDPQLSSNARLSRLNASPACAPMAEMTLVAGTDHGLLHPVIFGENDEVVPVDSVFCRTSDPSDGESSWLRAGHNRELTEFTEPFNHHNFGHRDDPATPELEGYRIRDHVQLRRTIMRGFTDWFVGEHTRFDVIQNGPFVQSVDVAVDVNYNAYERDIARLVVVVYARDNSGRWHATGPHVNDLGGIVDPRVVDGNSREMGVYDPEFQVNFTDDQEIVEVRLAVVGLAPDVFVVPPEPDSRFALP